MLFRLQSHLPSILTLTLTLFGGALVPNGAEAAEPLLQPGDRLAVVGGTLVEQMRSDASLEFELQTRRPSWQLRLRNVGWSGDNTFGFARKVFDTNPEKGFERLQYDLDLADPTVILFAYGFAEASNGASAVAEMERGLDRLVEVALQRQRRVILMKPFALPGVKTADYSQQLVAAGEVIDRVAAKHSVPVVTTSCEDFVANGLLPSPKGYQQIANRLAESLVGSRTASGELSAEAKSSLRDLIVRKEELFFHRHRPQNETYLLLFRKHEQGNNAVELPQFDPLVDELDQQIWDQVKPLAAAGI